MKKIILSILVLCFSALAVKAQDIPDRKREFRPQERNKRELRAPLKDLKLNEDQKDKMKNQKEEFHKQMEALKKNEDITVKEWKAKREALVKDHQAKMKDLLTKEQKDKLEKMKKDRQSMQK